MTAGGKGGARAMDAAALARARGELATAHGRRRLDLILDAADPGALVRALPADELYFTIREIGLADAAQLVQLASAGQFRTFLDLDAWRSGTVEPRRVLPWLRAARAGAARSDSRRRPAGAQARRPRRRGDRPRRCATPCASTTSRRTTTRTSRATASCGRRRASTSSSSLVAGTEYVAVRGLVDDLYAEDPFLATRILAAIRSELPSELEESALRWRTGRLADRGYPDLEEALSWFARPPARPALPAGEPARPPGFFLAQFRRGTLLDRAAEKLPPDERERVEQEVVAAANAVLVADAVDVGDPEAVRRAVETARAMLELGLEALASGDEERAAEALSATPVKRVFQDGFGRVLELCWRAERLFEDGGAGTREAPLLDAPLGEALARPRPAPAALLPGHRAPSATTGVATAAAAFEPRGVPVLAGPRAHRRGARPRRGARRARTASSPCATPASTAGPLAPRLSALYLTALANERLGRPFRSDPIPASELRSAARALERLEDPRLASEGEGGAVLARLAAARAEELAPLRDGGEVRPDHVDRHRRRLKASAARAPGPRRASSMRVFPGLLRRSGGRRGGLDRLRRGLGLRSRLLGRLLLLLDLLLLRLLLLGLGDLAVRAVLRLRLHRGGGLGRALGGEGGSGEAEDGERGDDLGCELHVLLLHGSAAAGCRELRSRRVDGADGGDIHAGSRNVASRAQRNVCSICSLGEDPVLAEHLHLAPHVGVEQVGAVGVEGDLHARVARSVWRMCSQLLQRRSPRGWRGSSWGRARAPRPARGAGPSPARRRPRGCRGRCGAAGARSTTARTPSAPVPAVSPVWTVVLSPPRRGRARRGPGSAPPPSGRSSRASVSVPARSMPTTPRCRYLMAFSTMICVEPVVELAGQAEDEPGLDAVLEHGPVHAPERGVDDVVEVALAVQVALHGVEAQLDLRDAAGAVLLADDLVDAPLDGLGRATGSSRSRCAGRARYSSRRAHLARPGGDQLHELEVVLETGSLKPWSWAMDQRTCGATAPPTWMCRSTSSRAIAGI